MSKITLNDYYFDINNKIGKGSSGVVFSGYHTKTKERVAIKRVDINDLNRNNKNGVISGKNKIGKIWNEIEIMKELDHANIIKLLDVYVDMKNEYLYLIMEFCDGGDLSDYIDDYTLDLTQVKEFITSLKDGLEYLHNRGVVHRDLKPHNLLIKNTNNKLVIKIADFGLSAFQQDGGLMQTMCGSPLYMSPEIIEHQKYTAKSDLWSIGIIIYQLIYHRHPYDNCKNYAELVRLVKTEPIKYPSKPLVDNLTIDLLQGLLDKNCHNRISWEDFFNHPWFKHPFGTTPPDNSPINLVIATAHNTNNRSLSPQSNNSSMDMDLMFNHNNINEPEIIESIDDNHGINLSIYLVENYNRNDKTSNKGYNENRIKGNKENENRIKENKENENRIKENKENKENTLRRSKVISNGSPPRPVPSEAKMIPNSRSSSRHHRRYENKCVDIYGTSAPETKRYMGNSPLEYSPSSLTFSSMGTSLLEYVSTSYDWIKNSIEF